MTLWVPMDLYWSLHGSLWHVRWGHYGMSAWAFTALNWPRSVLIFFGGSGELTSSSRCGAVANYHFLESAVWGRSQGLLENGSFGVQTFRNWFLEILIMIIKGMSKLSLYLIEND